MLNRLGTLSGRFCTLCALCFCCVIFIQNLLRLSIGQLPAVLVGLLLGCLVLFACKKLLRPFRGFASALFLARFALALFFILWLNSQPVQDFDTMYSAALQLARGSREYLDNIYFFNWAYQSAFVAYEALVIALFGDSLLPLQLLNAVYLAGTNVLVYLTAKRFLPEKAAMTAGILYAIYPAPLFLAGVLTNQHLSVFLLYSALYLLLGKDLTPLRALGAGTIMALGNAMRPIGVILMLASLLWLLIRAAHRADLRTALHGIYVAVSYFAVGAALSGLIIVTGINPEGLSNNQPMWKFVVGLNQDSSGCWNRTDYETYLSLPTDQAHETMTEEVKNRLSVGPVALADLALRKSAVMWAGNEDLYWGFGHLEQEVPAITFPITLSWNSIQLLLGSLDKGIYLLAFALALVGLLLRLRRPEQCGRSLLLVLLLCGYYAVHLIVEVQSRYRYFLMPCVFLLAGIAVTRLLPEKDHSPLDP
ncbi:MAG: glycosyltransferase family 39 protein [Ruminococcaceae bacterium]|nr:glycosyltransferase family 39 protein [Oscillospiraceae bacterium]